MTMRHAPAALLVVSSYVTFAATLLGAPES